MVTPDDGTVRFWNMCSVRGQKGHNKSCKKQCICWFNYLNKYKFVPKGVRCKCNAAM
jgi:hypothetical protein